MPTEPTAAPCSECGQGVVPFPDEFWEWLDSDEEPDE